MLAMLQHIGPISGIAAHEDKYIVMAGCGPVRTRLRAAMAPLLIAGAVATALVVASRTTSAPVTEKLCMSGDGDVHTMGTNASTVTAVQVPARPVAVQIPVNTCLHPCDALYQSRTERCGDLRGSKDSLCMSEAADRHGDCLSVFK
jgi:hypothetical protein